MQEFLSLSSLKYAVFFLIEQLKKSCALFRPSELKKIVLASLNTYAVTIKLLISVGWYFLLMPFLQILLLIQGKTWFAGFVFFIWSYVLILLLRPSIRQKKIKYFLQYTQHMWGFLIVISTMLCLFVKLPEFILYTLGFTVPPWFFLLLVSIATPPTLFGGFLFVDTELDLLQAFYKGLLMFVCTVPFCLIFSIMFFFPLGLLGYYVVTLTTRFIPNYVVHGIEVLLLSVFFLAQAVLYNSVYLKVIYENIEVYIGGQP